MITGAGCSRPRPPCPRYRGRALWPAPSAAT
jgi:hypothetical protein